MRGVHLFAGRGTVLGLWGMMALGLGCTGSDPVIDDVTDDVSDTGDAPVDSGPRFTGSFDHTVVEGEGAIIPVEVSDPDGDVLSVTIGGEDASRFVVSSGQFAVIVPEALDYEDPADADGDNVYHFTLAATDGDTTVEQDYTVTITNVPDTAFEITGGLLLRGSELFEYDEPETGSSVAGIGDVDGDGLDDLAVAAPDFSVTGDFNNEGRTYVLPARALRTVREAVVDLDALTVEAGVRLDGYAEANAGEGLGSFPDLDGDLVPELMVGMPGVSEAVILPSGTLRAGIEQGNGTILELEREGARMNSSLVDDDDIGQVMTPAGDLDGDGTVDLIVCADRARTNGSSVGRAFLVFGDVLGPLVAGEGTLDLDSTVSSDQRVVIEGLSSTVGGCDVASSAGDIDGDGLGDVLVGTRRSSGTARLRFVHVVFGAAVAAARAGDGLIRLDDAVQNGQALVFEPIDPTGIVQWSVSSLGDLNGDGFDDMLIGDRDEEQTYVVFGSDTLGQGTNGVIGLGSVVTDGIGVTLRGGRPDLANAGIFSTPLGDLDGDGVMDIVIAANDFDADVGVAVLVSGVELLAPREIDLSEVGSTVAGARITGIRGTRAPIRPPCSHLWETSTATGCPTS